MPASDWVWRPAADDAAALEGANCARRSPAAGCDIAFTRGARIYSTLLSMLVLILSARWLGPEGRGNAVVFTTWVTLGASILSLSLGHICVHRAAKESDQSRVEPILSALLIFTLIVTLLLLALPWPRSAR